MAVSRHPSRGDRSNFVGDRAEFIAAENVIELTKTRTGAMICLQGYMGKESCV